MAADKKAAKPAEKKQGPSKSRFTLYKVEGDKLSRSGKFCPKCGPGIFMASHADRVTCGKCGYMEKK